VRPVKIRSEGDAAHDAVLDQAETLAKESNSRDTIEAVRSVYGDSFERKRGEAFELAAVMVGDRELARLAPIEDLVRDALREIDEKRGGLAKEIEQLQASNDAKAAEIATLVEQVEKRKLEITNERRDRGWLESFLIETLSWEPSLEIAFADDEHLGELSDRLSALRSELSADETKILRYRTPRPELEADRVALETAARALFEALASDADRGVAVTEAEARRSRREALKDTLEGELVILERMKPDAEALDIQLGGLIRHLSRSIEALEMEIGRDDGPATLGRVSNGADWAVDLATAQ
jgi:hypothetical protein